MTLAFHRAFSLARATFISLALNRLKIKLKLISIKPHREASAVTVAGDCPCRRCIFLPSSSSCAASSFSRGAGKGVRRKKQRIILRKNRFSRKPRKRSINRRVQLRSELFTRTRSSFNWLLVLKEREKGKKRNKVPVSFENVNVIRRILIYIIARQEGKFKVFKLARFTFLHPYGFNGGRFYLELPSFFIPFPFLSFFNSLSLSLLSQSFREKRRNTDGRKIARFDPSA